ncbi:MAG: DUF5362 family protein [Bacteroidales bacterium]|nr:DUF5362 family protein [Bacteroidales bacterium]MCF8344516.1 DUF5362 family protein [Bacteroidales bacterium]MCF8350774.1 DUF5362 family protein [Bacteroidales bacterium]MCF8376859.1 DUF5362 family protein [Bacteroidales bacterium]MCF8401874.1 DUF5362 family protein [Bacteroidales bacterium]
MEEQLQQQNPQEQEGLQIPEITIKVLNETRRWTMFMAILGFIMSAFILLGALFLGSVVSFVPSDAFTTPFPTYFIPVLYLIIAFVNFMIALFLYKFSSRTKDAIHWRKPEMIHKALNNMKLYWRWVGILTIVAIVFMIGSFIYAIIFGVNTLQDAGFNYY